MSLLSSAKELARNGYPVFPLVPRSKLPAIKDFPHRATTDASKIEAWWASNSEYNIGISTENFLALDIDNKGKKKGDEEILRLELEGLVLPETYTQFTPTGGRHLLYRVGKPVKQGTNVLGNGLDIRGRGGYVVGAGSIVERGEYTGILRSATASPEWLVDRVGNSRPRDALSGTPLEGIEPSRAALRATRYLLDEAPLAVEGEGGDQVTFQVAARTKDFGVDALVCFELMQEHWNPRCTPPWSHDDLARKVENAYRYGNDQVGISAPEAQFDAVLPEKPVLHPFQKINQEFAYVIGDGSDFVLHETLNAEGQYYLKHLDIDAFHRFMAPHTMNFGGKTQAVSKLWVSDSARRTYHGVCFLPGKEAPAKFYNLWRGFSVLPAVSAPGEATQALDAWKSHLLENICGGETELANWLTGYFAHLVQRPWEKPLVSLVLKGRKGVGKNALVERVGHLLGPHSATISNRRYLTGNFNSLLENKLLLVLDEAFWSGDKAAEGVLKDLITGEYHTIERKGREPYRVRNCLRVAVLGNEEWLVPASEDERRFAVFIVGEGRKQDNKFFKSMREGMEHGGYSLLLDYLQKFDLSKIDVTIAPKTKGLMEQKANSLKPFLSWWADCLTEGRIISSDVEGWPTEISRERLRFAFYRYLKERNIGGWTPNDTAIGIELKKCAGIASGRKRDEGTRVYTYRFPDLVEARNRWDKFIGHKTAWEPADMTTEEEELFK